MGIASLVIADYSASKACFPARQSGYGHFFIIIGFFILSGYFAFFEWVWSGQTPGKPVAEAARERETAAGHVLGSRCPGTCFAVSTLCPGHSIRLA